jgi:RNA polymerase sigma-70 factor, ECF subfamily
VAADPDEELVARAQSGSLEAFGSLVERHRDVVYRVAARIVGVQNAADVSQDAFLRAFNRLDRFRGEGPFRAWLLQITHNAALREAGLRRPEPVDLEQDSVGDPEPSGPDRTPAATLERRERRERLERKISMLSPNHRSVLVLRDVEGLSYEDIASITEFPLGSVKGRLHRARNELIELLRANTYDWELPR